MTPHILLIGGASGVGKTALAQRLARELDASHLLVDDVRIALQAATTPAQLPALHFFLTNDPHELSVEAFVAGLIALADLLQPALRQIIEHHLAVPAAGRLVIEGDGIAPTLLAALLPGMRSNAADDRVRGVFIVEPDEARLLANFRARDRGFGTLDAAQQNHYAQAAWHYNGWLMAEAQRHNLPMLAAQPYETLMARVLGMFE